MENFDAASLGQRLASIGLITPQQMAEAQDELGRSNDAGALLRLLERKTLLTPWQSSKVLKGDMEGFVLGGYKLLYKIASGSFGRVFRAEDPATGRVVATKVLRRRWSEDQFRIDLFSREAKLGMDLKHPNIVEVLAMNHDAGSGQYYIVMEFVEGGNLREILQIRKKLSVNECLKLLEDMASGLAYAHSRGVTHRDIKLTNVLVTSTGVAKLVDFGLATLLTEAAGNNEKDRVERTVDYAGLERATEVKQGDVRSDIYFLGCVFYEMLTSRSPLTMSRNKQARMLKSRFEDVQPIKHEELDAPPSVFALVETMMSLSPQRRYQTPSQLLEAIRNVRREIEGKTTPGAAPTMKTLFIVEKDDRLQETLREKFKERSFRVLLSSDPTRVLERFRQQPFEAVIINADTTGEEGAHVFEELLRESTIRRSPCAAVLILNEEQSHWAQMFPSRAAQPSWFGP